MGMSLDMRPKVKKDYPFPPSPLPRSGWVFFSSTSLRSLASKSRRKWILPPLVPIHTARSVYLQVLENDSKPGFCLEELHFLNLQVGKGEGGEKGGRGEEIGQEEQDELDALLCSCCNPPLFPASRPPSKTPFSPFNMWAGYWLGSYTL